MAIQPNSSNELNEMVSFGTAMTERMSLDQIAEIMKERRGEPEDAEIVKQMDLPRFPCGKDWAEKDIDVIVSATDSGEYTIFTYYSGKVEYRKNRPKKDQTAEGRKRKQAEYMAAKRRADLEARYRNEQMKKNQ
jgi:hypothetical protein